MKISRVCCVAGISLIVLAGFCGVSRAQSTAAMVSGEITDPQGKVVPGVAVVFTNINTGVPSTAQTNTDGIYSLPALQPGIYRANVTKDGFKSIVKTGIELHVQDQVSINFALEVGSVSETITVSGGAPMVDTESAAVGTVVDQQFIENIPMNGRSFQSLILLTPGVNAVPNASVNNQGEFSINGQRTEANYYTVDGVSANTGQYNIWQVGATPQETQLGTTQSLVSLDALQEFRINTSTYSAEYGRMPGGQISFQTRPGTNAWHGSLFDYFRNNVLDANNWFNNAANLPPTAEQQNDFGGTVGGPIRIPGVYNGTDKTFFFFSYEGLRLIVPQPAETSDVPDNALRQAAPVAIQPLIDAFPLANGADLGNGLALFTATYSAPSSLDAYSIRVDHSLGEKLKLFGRYADTPSSVDSRGAPGNFANPQDVSSDIKVVTIGATSVFSPHLVNELRFNYTNNNTISQYSQDNFGGATPLTTAQVFPGITIPKYYYFSSDLFFGSYPGVFLGTNTTPSNQWNIVDTLTFTFGSHTLKFGIDYRRQYGLEGVEQLSDFSYYDSASDVIANTAPFAEVFSIGIPPGGIFKNFSAFAEDEWKVTNRLHLSLGLRWDLNPPPTGQPNNPYTLNEISNLATATLAPQGTALWHTDYRGFAPRLGIAYQLHQNPEHETVVRGGFGVFYDMGTNNALFGSTGGVGVGSTAFYPNAAFPFTAAQQTLPPPSIAPPWSSVSADDPNLRLPYTLQWNAAIEQGLGSNQTLTVSYVGSGGRKLLHSQYISPSDNPNFGAEGSIYLVTNGGTSDYNALQAEFQRRLSHGLQALASYTWSHAIDDESFNGNWSDGIGTEDVLLRGNADFDVRHNFSAALTYAVPGSYANPVAGALLKHWGIDLRQTNRTAFPVDITDGYSVIPFTGQNASLIPDLVPGVPIYLNNPTAPGGRVINFNAFTTPAGPIGDEPRNFVRGFGAWQTDLAIRREFPIHERLRLQFRGEAFNLFNHPNFGSIYSDISYYGPTQFGQAWSTLNNQLGGLNPLYQMGGPRSFQLALKLLF
jgi:hypothetical protein